MDRSKDVRARAETNFKKEQQLKEGAKAWAEYQAQANAVRERTVRLRELRLARESTEPAREKPKALKKAAR